MGNTVTPGYTLRLMTDFQLKNRIEIVLDDIEATLKHEPGTMGKRYGRLADTHEYLMRAWHSLNGLARTEKPTSQERHRWTANERQ